MRVLQVMASGLHGGAELFYEDLVPALSRAGLDQACVIRPYPTRAAKLEAAGCRVTMLPFGGPLDLLTVWRLKAVARREQPRIIMGWMNRACRSLPKGPWINVGRLGGYYDLKYYRRCRELICNTPDIRAYVIKQGWPEAHAHYIPNYCPVTPEPAVDRASLDTPAGAKVLLVLARLQSFKGVHIAIEALRDVPDAVLWIAGDGMEENNLRRLAASLGVAQRVRFLGWREDRGALLRAADICLVPSLHEPFGNVVVNAWAYGTPLIASNAQGPDFLIRHGTDGLKVPSGDARALAAAITTLLGDQALARRLVEGGLARTRDDFPRPRSWPGIGSF